MTRDEIIKIAAEVGGREVDEVDPQCFIGLMAFEVWELERFAALVAAAERELGYTEGYAAGYDNGHSEGFTKGADLCVDSNLEKIRAVKEAE